MKYKIRRLNETLEKYEDVLDAITEPLYVDAYNRTINENGLAGTLTSRIVASSQYFIIEPITNRGGQFGCNTASQGVSRCIKANYYKMSLANFLHDDGRAATGVIEIIE